MRPFWLSCRVYMDDQISQSWSCKHSESEQNQTSQLIEAVRGILVYQLGTWPLYKLIQLLSKLSILSFSGNSEENVSHAERHLQRTSGLSHLFVLSSDIYLLWGIDGAEECWVFWLSLYLFIKQFINRFQQNNSQESVFEEVPQNHKEFLLTCSDDERVEGQTQPAHLILLTLSFTSSSRRTVTRERRMKRWRCSQAARAPARSRGRTTPTPPRWRWPAAVLAGPRRCAGPSAGGTPRAARRLPRAAGGRPARCRPPTRTNTSHPKDKTCRWGQRDDTLMELQRFVSCLLIRINVRAVRWRRRVSWFWTEILWSGA